MKFKKIFQSSLIISALTFLMCTNCYAQGTVSEGSGVEVVFNATVSESIPDDVKMSIGTELNSWNPKDTEWVATKIDSTHYQLKVNISRDWIGKSIEYKWTLQYPNITDPNDTGWSHVENIAASGTFGNRKLTVVDGKNEVTDEVTFSKDAASKVNTVTKGKLETFEMEMPQFGDARKRTIRVWLPEGYNSSDKKTTYPVMYMHDGQNLFDAATSFSGEWNVDESVTEAAKEGYASSIVVGVDNGQNLRFNELSPDWELSTLGKNYISETQGDKYAKFIVETLKPYIDSHYNTKTERQYTGIGGSSMGGDMSFYMAIKYSNIFGKALVFSPAMSVFSENTLDTFLDKYQIKDNSEMPKMFIFAGGTTGSEGPGTPGDESIIYQYVAKIKDALIKRGYNQENIQTLTDKSKIHTESTWSQYFPTAYKWLEGKNTDTSNIKNASEANTVGANKAQANNPKTKDTMINSSIIILATIALFTFVINIFRKKHTTNC